MEIRFFELLTSTFVCVGCRHRFCLCLRRVCSLSVGRACQGWESSFACARSLVLAFGGDVDDVLTEKAVSCSSGWRDRGRGNPPGTRGRKTPRSAGSNRRRWKEQMDDLWHLQVAWQTLAEGGAFGATALQDEEHGRAWHFPTMEVGWCRGPEAVMDGTGECRESNGLGWPFALGTSGGHRGGDRPGLCVLQSLHHHKSKDATFTMCREACEMALRVEGARGGARICAVIAIQRLNLLTLSRTLNGRPSLMLLPALRRSMLPQSSEVTRSSAAPRALGVPSPTKRTNQ